MNKAIYKPLVSLLLALLLVVGCSTTADAAEVDSVKMRLNTPGESGSTAFAVENMFPGDAEVKDYTVKVAHKEIVTLYYHADIRPGYEKLAEVMMVKIELPEEGITLYDGLMGDMTNALEHQLAADEKEVIYRITAYLDTGVGNEYQFKSLIADFRWWYQEETEDSTESPDDPITPADPTTPIDPTTPADPTDSTAVTDSPEHAAPDISGTPKTGDGSNITLYMTMITGSLAALIFLLLLIKRTKEEAAHE